MPLYLLKDPEYLIQGSVEAITSDKDAFNLKTNKNNIMRVLNNIKTLICLAFFLTLLVSCKDDDDRIDTEVQKTTGFVAEVNSFDFFIEGEIDDNLLHYKQVNDEWTNVSNKYFVDYEETWLQAYSDSLTREGSWRIRVHDLDISAMQLPYTLKLSEGSIRWFDSRVDLIIPATDFCQGIDNGCTFVLRPDRGTITITKVEDQIIEGEFSGRAIVVRTDFTPEQDETLYHDIENGKFRIQYRVE